MATLLDLKTRIISETTRDDLADDLAVQFSNIIAKSIEQYANERWFFNEYVTNTATIANSNAVPVPNGFRTLDSLLGFTSFGGVGYPLKEQPITLIFEWRAANESMRGPPTDFAMDGFNFNIWPTPATVYPLRVRYIGDVTPPLLQDSDSNVWTNQGQDLIVAQAKIRLYRDYLSAIATDPRLVTARGQEQDAYSRLRSESNRRTATGRIQPAW